MYIGLTKDMVALGEFYREWTGLPYDMGSISWDCHDVVAKEDGEIVGALRLIIINDPIWHRKWGLIENVFVSEADRKRGVATEMMRFVEGQAKSFGCEFVKLTSRKEEGQELYRSLEYEEGCSYRRVL